MQDGIAVIVCTYNGAARIEKTLEHLADQKFSAPISWEVIVVDNASTDHTGQLIDSFRNIFHERGVAFRTATERKTGKIHALTLGVSKISFSNFIICDDDNRLAADYVEKMYQRLNSDDKIGAVGGQSDPISEKEIPSWFWSTAGDYAVGKQGKHTGDVTVRGYLWGAGLGSKTRLFHEMYEGFPSLLTGRKESTLSAGEDGEYCIRLVAKGYRLFYDEQLHFDHYIPPHRLTEDYRNAVIKGIQSSMDIIDKYAEAISMRQKTTHRPLNRWRLNLVTPFRIWLTKSEIKKKRQRNKWQFLLPMEQTTDQDMQQIKKFMGIMR
ncbi:glycosyltransferase [Pollutibacter soli]|uniref:glycosyltransferase n=1 Tax=Pollutibacter soli TaxID=3034157 RepID=UPI00301336C9